MEPLIKGLIMGFSIAAPVGPIGILCIQRTLNHGWLSGLLTGLGAATADAAYGAVAAFGLIAIAGFFTGHEMWLRLFGGLFLFYLGARIFLSSPAHHGEAKAHRGVLYDYLSTFVLTLTNPMTIFTFFGLFAGAGLASGTTTTAAAAWMVFGVLLGSALWWLLLSAGITLFRAAANEKFRRIVNKVSGAVIIAFAIFMLGGLEKL